jgi:glycosyltransferase involved in cell wall biosynthesis
VKVLLALMFFPRGGSAQVTRYLAKSLAEHGWESTLVAGSAPGEADATEFFKGLDVRPVDYSAALEAEDPLLAHPPMHPSYEDREGAPDRVFAKVDDPTYEHLVEAWQKLLTDAGAADADVLHLNHLTPMNEAAERAFPGVPRVGHLHGTELLMLREIDEGPPAGWTYARQWADRMRRWAQSCDRLLVLSPDAVRRVPDLLDVDPGKVVWAPNGFDPEIFDRRPLTGDKRHALWRKWLVDEPRGWGPEDQEPGSVSYVDDDLAAFDEGPVLLYVGRYTEVKRIPLLIRAHALARERFEVRAPLVILGGHPGEWEGEHPLEVIRDSGASDVFLAGWHSHDDLADGLNASDLTVLPSVREQFGQVIVEGMACGVPAVAVDAHGPATIIEAGEDGWLVPADDEEAMADALVEAVNDAGERRRRGENAYESSRSRYSWPALAKEVASVYGDVVEGKPESPTAPGPLPDIG